jgi:hypothetical protein
VLHEVRAACRNVVADAVHVRVDDGAVDELAARLVAESEQELTAGLRDPNAESGLRDPDTGTAPLCDPWAIDPDWGDDERRAGLVLTLAAVAFGSGYHPDLHKRPGCSGATTIAAALREWADDEPLTADRLASVSAADTAGRFGQPADGGPRDELMGLMAGALAELGCHVRDEHGGSFLDLVASAEGRAATLVGLLARLPRFRDVADHLDRPVPFYKRAQLAAADLDRAFRGRAPAAFGDLDDLTAFADNLVPHVLRIEGVLHYDGDLLARIDRGELLPAGSTEEVEIRAAGVEGVERLRAALAVRGMVTRSSDLDARLWRRGGGARFKAVPRHRTRTVFY